VGQQEKVQAKQHGQATLRKRQRQAVAKPHGISN
jgi:hypothetical protein